MELRLRIFRILEERRRVAPSDMPTAGEIAEAVGEPLRKVVVTLRSSAAMNMVWLAEGLNEAESDIPVMLKPAAFIYLESAMNEASEANR